MYNFPTEEIITDLPTDRERERETDMMVHRDVTLSITTVQQQWTLTGNKWRDKVIGLLRT